jgi:Uma2 family endonuclease
MNVVRRTAVMSREQFLVWAEAQQARHEFDGFAPVAMTCGTRDHSRICQNIHATLRPLLRGTGCESLGPDAGIATIGDAVRYPDALVTCTKGLGSDRLIAGAVVLFEVLSPNSGRTDRIDKLMEYRAVAGLRRYIMLEYASMAATIHSRQDATDPWTTTVAVEGDVVSMPELGVEVPLEALYEGTDLVA